MRERHGRNFPLRRRSTQKFVARFAGGHFQPHPLCQCPRVQLPSLAHERQTQSRGSRLNQLLVSIAFRTAQLMIEMSGYQPPSVPLGKVMEQVEQHHGIQPAGNRHQNRLATAKELSRLDGFPDLVKQLAHRKRLVDSSPMASWPAVTKANQVVLISSRPRFLPAAHTSPDHAPSIQRARRGKNHSSLEMPPCFQRNTPWHW